MTETEVRGALESHPGVKSIARGDGIHAEIVFVWGHPVNTDWPSYPGGVEDRLDVDLAAQSVQWVPGRSGGIMRDPVALSPASLMSEAAKLWTEAKS